MDGANHFKNGPVHRVVIDLSSMLWTNLLVGKDKEYGIEVEFEGKKIFVNSGQYGYDNAMDFTTTALKMVNVPPSDVIIVLEGKESKLYRKTIFSDYKSSDNRSPEQYEAFQKARTMFTEAFLKVGASVATQDNVEGDDVIAYLAENLEGPVTIFSNDGDLSILVNEKVQLYRMGKMITENPYGPWPTKFITLYKALVGDKSDNMPGAFGFGDKAWLKLVTMYGDEGLEIFQLLCERNKLSELEEDVADLPELSKVLDNADTVIKCFKCAKLYPDRVNTMRTPLIWTVGRVAPRSEIQDDRLKHLGVS